MSILSHLVELFSEDAGIEALVKSGDDPARVYLGFIPQAPEYPCISMFQISGPRGHTLRGADGYVQARIQVDCWAETYTALKDPDTGLAVLVRKKLDGYKGRLKGVGIRSSILANERELPEPDIGVYRISMDFSIWHTEAT